LRDSSAETFYPAVFAMPGIVAELLAEEEDELLTSTEDELAVAVCTG
jgi:hypothetical protein